VEIDQCLLFKILVSLQRRESELDANGSKKQNKNNSILIVIDQKMVMISVLK
jgi:hypothetical protein